MNNVITKKLEEIGHEIKLDRIKKYVTKVNLGARHEKLR